MTKTIIVPIDLSSQDSASFALDQLRQFEPRANLRLLHVITPLPDLLATGVSRDFRESLEKSAQSQLREFADWNGVSTQSELVIRKGHAGREIVRHAEETEADMIVLASRDPGWSGVTLGSVAAFVVRHAKCSVLVIRTPLNTQIPS